MSGTNQVHPIFQPLIDAIAPKTVRPTPGPWKVDKGLNFDVYIRATVGTLDPVIARLDHKAETAANAKLIASAPDLAKSLSDLLDAFRECVGHAAFDEFDASNPAVIAAREALAKAGL